MLRFLKYYAAVSLVVWQASIFAAPPTESRFTTDSQSLDDFYRSKLLNVDGAELDRCRRSDDVGLALQATWELVAREASGQFDADQEADVRVGSLDSRSPFTARLTAPSISLPRAASHRCVNSVLISRRRVEKSAAPSGSDQTQCR